MGDRAFAFFAIALGTVSVALVALWVFGFKAIPHRYDRPTAGIFSL
jgi:hypothetical protein